MCSSLESRLLGCKNNSGGVNEIFISDFNRGETFVYNNVSEIYSVSTWTDGSATYSQFTVETVEDPNIPGEALYPKVGDLIEIRFPTSIYSVLNDTGIEVMSINFNATTGIANVKTNQLSIITGDAVGYNGLLIYNSTSSEISIMPTNLTFYSIQQPRETANWNENGIGNVENHSSYFEKIVTLNLFNVGDTISYINTIQKGKWFLIVKDNNGYYWLINTKSPADVDTINGGSGKLMLDLNGYTVVFKAYDTISSKIKQGAWDRMVAAGQIIN